jgi:hypothetical protein
MSLLGQSESPVARGEVPTLRRDAIAVRRAPFFDAMSGSQR